MAPQPKVINNGIVAPRMGGKGGKGSLKMKENMSKLRAMRKGKMTKLEY